MPKRNLNAKKKKTAAELRQTAFIRFMIVIAVFVVWFGGVGARLVYLQITQHEPLRSKAVSQRRDVQKSRMPRGTIYDRNGRALAISVSVKTLYADATAITDIGKAADDIAKALKTKPAELRKTLEEAKELGRKAVPIAKGLDATEVEAIERALDTPNMRKAGTPKYEGLFWRDSQKRSYPHGPLAAHVIGFSDAEGVGQAGIEQSQNEVLYGAVIRREQERDRLGRVYDEVVTEKSPPGDVVLTIDNSAQYFAETALANAVKNANAKAGMAVVIANKTGEVLALANYPTFDPSKLETLGENNLRNAAIQNMYTPGSVFKLITYSSARERDLVRPDNQIDLGAGTIEIGSRRFSDSGRYGSVSYSRAMAVSSNVGAIRTAMRVGKKDFHQSIVNFGFGSPTGIELPAETAGVVRSPERWFGDSLASMAIGYEIGVSALQMATAFATIANDGVRIQPHIIKEIRDHDETIVSAANPANNRVVSVETARDIREMLKEVVVSGTGKNAALSGYTAAGKTGTAWKFDEKLKRVNSAKYISSFIGMAPADNPEITIAVIIDEPKIGGRGGGAVAAPVFKEIADKLLPAMNIPSGGSPQVLVDEEDELIAETVGNGESLDGDEADSAVIEETKDPKPVPKKGERERIAAAATPGKKPDVAPKRPGTSAKIKNEASRSN